MGRAGRAAFPKENATLPPTLASCSQPCSDWAIEDDWHVAGQAGTGSKTVVLNKPTFVPGHRKLTFAEAASGAPPGPQ